jgi:hypothetical protein
VFSDSRKDWAEWWEKTRTRGYWASYFLIPIILFPIILRSYERHDGMSGFGYWLESPQWCAPL